MGYYNESPPEEQPPGCLDVLLITRAVLGIIFIPLVIIGSVGFGIGIAFYLFTLHPALVLVPLAVAAIGIWLYARWEQRHYRPPGL